MARVNFFVQYSCLSHIGKRRAKNQDNFFCGGTYLHQESRSLKPVLTGSLSCKQPFLLGVFDGLGGEERGEMASLIAAECAAEAKIGEDPVTSLREFCKKTNEKICAYATDNGISAMGTTAALLAFSESGITLCNIGDSKVFRLADRKLVQISVDHYGVAAHGVKPPLAQYLGIPPTEMLIDPYFATGCCNDGDVYLLCSDGLTDMVPTQTVLQILNGTELPAAAERLLAAALENGGKDNVTILLCKIEKEKSKLFNRLFHMETEKER